MKVDYYKRLEKKETNQHQEIEQPKEKETNRCRKCGKVIPEKYNGSLALWCNKCRDELDEKLEKKEGVFDLFFQFFRRGK